MGSVPLTQVSHPFSLYPSLQTDSFGKSSSRSDAFGNELRSEFMKETMGGLELFREASPGSRSNVV